MKNKSVHFFKDRKKRTKQYFVLKHIKTLLIDGNSADQFELTLILKVVASTHRGLTTGKAKSLLLCNLGWHNINKKKNGLPAM